MTELQGTEPPQQEEPEAPPAATWPAGGDAAPSAPADAPPDVAPLVTSPYARLPTRPGRVLAGALDLLTQASPQLRRASFYVGAIVLALATPFAFLLVRSAMEPFGVVPAGAESPLQLASLVALLGILLVAVEARAVAVVLLASRLGGRPFDLRAAVQRSRTIFWRLLAALTLVNVLLYLAQLVIGQWAVDVLGPNEPGVLTGSVITAIVFAPLTWIVTAVVLGDLGPVAAIRRSIRLFRTSKVTGVIVALFEFGSQLLTVYGLLAGLDLVFRLVDAAGVTTLAGPSGIVVGFLVVMLLFAGGTLLFTVAALSLAPQVVAYLALTHLAPGLDRIGGGDSTFRWLPRPMLAAVIVGAVALFAGLDAFS